MRVLITCVGTRDPYWDRERNQYYSPDGSPMPDEGPILSFYHKMVETEGAPDWIYLISTDAGPEVREPTKAHGEATQERLKTLGVPEVRHLWLRGINPTDYEMLMPELRRHIDQILHETQAYHPTYVINQSPGTPQMRAVLYALVHAGIIPALLYQTKPYKHIHIDLLYEDELKKSALRLLENFAFDAAGVLFDDLAHRALDDNRAVIARHIAQLCTAYWEWNRFDYSKSAMVMQDIFGGDVIYRSELADLHQLITRQLSALNRLTDPQQASHFRTIDLYCKAEYLQLIGQYSDSIWRCAGMCEQILRIRIRDHLESRTGLQPDTDQFRDWLHQNRTHTYIHQFITQYFVSESIPRFLGLGEALGLADRMRFDVPEIALSPALHAQVRDLQGLRNGAIHRQQPVTKAESDRALQCAREVLEESGTFEQQMRDYPFSPRDFETLCQLAGRFI